MPYIPDRMNPVDTAIINAVYANSQRLWDLSLKMVDVAKQAPCECSDVNEEGVVPFTLKCQRCLVIDEFYQIVNDNT